MKTPFIPACLLLALGGPLAAQTPNPSPSPAPAEEALPRPAEDWAGPAPAIDGGGKAPLDAIKLQADSGSYDGQRQLATYSGNVIIEQGRMKLWGNKVLIYFSNGRVQKVEAQGAPVKFVYKPKNEPEILGRGNSVVYDVPRDQISIKGSAYIKQGANETRAVNLTYDLKREYLKTQRVNMIFVPSKK